MAEDFISRWETWLKNYERKFVFTALKVCSTLRIEVPHEELRSFFVMLYHQTFLSKDMDVSSCVMFMERLKLKGVDLKFVATKAFFLAVADFATQCFHKESSIEPLKELLERIDRVLKACSEITAPKEEKEEKDIVSLVRRLISHREKAVDFSDIDPEGEENRRIIEELRELQKRGESVELFNIYKGLHVKSTAQIVKVDKEGVVLEVGTTTQMGAIAADWYTLIKHPSWRVGLYGEVKNIEPERRRVRLWRFKRSLGEEERRESVRVKPKDVTPVSVKNEKGVDLIGYLLDVSLDHINIFVPKEKLPFGEGEDLKLELSLEDCRTKEEMKLQLEGSAFALRPLKEGTSFVVRLKLSSREETKLSVYLTCRQKEIVKDLSDYVKEYLS